MRVCEVEGCGGKHVGHGYCDKHCTRYRKYGSPHAFKRQPDLKGRFYDIGWDVTADGCWEWRGRRETGDHNYGTVHQAGRWARAHRVSYEIHVGPIPDGLLIRHKCDNPPCVNPDHLIPGTHKQNMEDKAERKRGGSGWIVGRAVANTKLSAEQVLEIRRKFAAGARNNELAREFGISTGGMSEIVNGKKWKWLLPSHPQSAAA